MKKNKGNILVIIVISALVLYLVLKDNFTEKIKYLFSINPIFLIIALIFIIIYWILKGLALHTCINEFDKDYTKKKSIRLMITTQLFHGITPFATGGQPWQIYKLKKHGISLSKGTNIVIEDFIGYQAALIIFGFLAVMSNHIFHVIPSDDKLGYLVTFGFVINSMVIFALFFLSFGKKTSKKILNSIIDFLGKIKILKKTDEKKQKVSNFLKDFHESAEILLKNKEILYKIVILNFFALTFQYATPFIILLGLKLYVNPFYVIVTSAYVMLIDSIIPTPGSTGGLEYGFMSFFKNFITGPKLSITMILWRFVTYYFGIIVGLFFLKEDSK